MRDALLDGIFEIGSVYYSLNDRLGEHVADFLDRSKDLSMVCLKDNQFSLLMTKITTATEYPANC